MEVLFSLKFLILLLKRYSLFITDLYLVYMQYKMSADQNQLICECKLTEWYNQLWRIKAVMPCSSYFLPQDPYEQMGFQLDFSLAMAMREQFRKKRMFS